MKAQTHFSLLDRLCLGFDQVLRSLTDNPKTSGKRNPAEGLEEAALNDDERQHAAALMRINHAGEVCAQALYQGQAVFSRTSDLQAKMGQAAIEEGDHLAWCKTRISELASHTSYLNPLWYAGSFCIGMVAGMVGDRWSLGFVAETERQVIKHLGEQLQRLPKQDIRSYRILQQMEKEEAEHRDEAIAAGAKELPEPIKQAMALTAKIMVKTSYWL